jgi:hypothetical protein
MPLWRRFSLLPVILAAATLSAQEPPPPQQQPAPQPQQQQPAPQPAPQPPPEAAPQPAPQPEPPVLSRAASGAYERRDSLPYFNLYIPEGQASIRLRKLIKNVLFESQIDYKFVNGDISTFLRYKYYARDYTYKISVFDTIGFENLGASAEFQRVRGGLLLTEFPRDYNHRYFWLVQDDRLTFGDVTRVDNRKNNIYTKIGYQYGTEFDEHMNAIVGESRGRIVPVLTAFRDIGPQKFSYVVALTESAKLATGDYHYTKLEGEALRRFDITPTSFVVTRVHAGIFPTKSKIRTWCTDDTNRVCGTGTPPPVSIAVPPFEQYSVPNYEFFDLGGREALLGVKSNDESHGITEFHVTNEYFLPIFRNRDYRTYLAHWNTLYGIGYMGLGNVGFNYTDPIKPKNYVIDVGLGTEASITIRDFEVLLSAVYAKPARAPGDLRGGKVHLSIRTIR